MKRRASRRVSRLLWHRSEYRDRKVAPRDSPLALQLKGNCRINVRSKCSGYTIVHFHSQRTRDLCVSFASVSISFSGETFISSKALWISAQLSIFPRGRETISIFHPLSGAFRNVSAHHGRGNRREKAGFSSSRGPLKTFTSRAEKDPVGGHDYRLASIAPRSLEWRIWSTRGGHCAA